MNRLARFRYENDIVRYCEIDAADRLNCWSPRTSLKVTAEPPKMSPPLVTPTLTGGRPSMNIFSNVPFFLRLPAISVCDSGAWKSMTGPGAPKSDEAAVTIGSRRSSVCSS